MVIRLEVMSAERRTVIRIKPSLVPFAWKGLLVIMLGLVLSVGLFVFQSLLPFLFGFGYLLTFAGLGLVGLGFLMVLIGLSVGICTPIN